VSPRAAVTQMPPVVTRAEAARRSRVPSTHDDHSSLPSPMDDVEPTEAPLPPRVAATMDPVVTRAEAARSLQAPTGGGRNDPDSDHYRNDHNRDHDTLIADLQRQLADARGANRPAHDLPRPAEQVTTVDPIDIYKVLKFARTVRRLDCITRSPSAWAEYVSDLRTCTLSSPLMRDCIQHVETQDPDTSGPPNNTAADHALFTLLQATTTGLAHRIVSGLERSGSRDQPSGIAALHQLRDAVQPSTLGDYYTSLRAVTIPTLTISSRHDPRAPLLRYTTEVKTVENMYNVHVANDLVVATILHALPSEYDTLCISLLSRPVRSARPTVAEVIQLIQELYTGVLSHRNKSEAARYVAPIAPPTQRVSFNKEALQSNEPRHATRQRQARRAGPDPPHNTDNCSEHGSNSERHAARTAIHPASYEPPMYYALAVRIATKDPMDVEPLSALNCDLVGTDAHPQYPSLGHGGRPAPQQRRGGARERRAAQAALAAAAVVEVESDEDPLPVKPPKKLERNSTGSPPAPPPSMTPHRLLQRPERTIAGSPPAPPPSTTPHRLLERPERPVGDSPATPRPGTTHRLPQRPERTPSVPGDSPPAARPGTTHRLPQRPERTPSVPGDSPSAARPDTTRRLLQRPHDEIQPRSSSSTLTRGDVKTTSPTPAAPLAPREAPTTSDDAIAIAPPAPTPDVTTHATQALVRLRSPEEQFNTELFSAPGKQHLPRNYTLQDDAFAHIWTNPPFEDSIIKSLITKAYRDWLLVAVKYFWLRELIESNTTKPQHISGAINPADFHTSMDDQGHVISKPPVGNLPFSPLESALRYDARPWRPDVSAALPATPYGLKQSARSWHDREPAAAKP
jgi:hypothetical protein